MKSGDAFRWKPGANHATTENVYYCLYWLYLDDQLWLHKNVHYWFIDLSRDKFDAIVSEYCKVTDDCAEWLTLNDTHKSAIPFQEYAWAKEAAFISIEVAALTERLQLLNRNLAYSLSSCKPVKKTKND